jgi:UDP-N-acetylmuramoylalanine--D-glutamate ligase
MMAAIAAAKCAGVSRAVIQQVLERFPGLEHRLEFIREKDGARYYNDSKGTNVGAVVKSLASFSAPVILLAGGVDKGGDYGVLAGEIRQKVRRLILFGAAKEVMAGALGHLTETVIVEDIQSAVRDAAEHARAGDVVLLSPACSSFDQFPNYAERGKVFKKLVREL